MKILHISDIKLNLPHHLLSEKPETLINRINSDYSGTEVFVINVNYICDGVSRANNPGILLLKYLRLHHFNQHCILYSFLSREQLMQMNPGNIILFSPGVSFVRMPADLNSIYYESLVSQTASDDLSVYFKAEFNLPDNRHYYANWWGLYQLWQVHKLLNYKEYAYLVDSEIECYPKVLIAEREKLNSRIAQYLFGFDIEKEISGFKEAKNEFDKTIGKYRDTVDVLKKLDLDLQDLHANLNDDEYQKQLLFTKKRIAEIKETYSTFLNNEELDWYYKDIRNSNLKAIPKKEIIDTRESIIEKYQEYVCSNLNTAHEKGAVAKAAYNNYYESQVKCYLSGRLSPVLKSGFQETRELCLSKSKDLRVFYIDDQAEEGWSDIFKLMIYDDIKTELFQHFVPNKEKSITTQFNKEILPIVNSFKPDIILLDLRLQGETGHINDLKKISGIIVLKLLKSRNETWNIPVMITTASNKYHTLKEIENIGAEAYWVKEGLDEIKEESGSAENYLSFIENIVLLSDERYKTLQHFDDLVNQIKTKTRAKLYSNIDIKTDIALLSEIVKESKIIFRKYLQHDIFLTNKSIDKGAKWLWPGMIVQNLGKIVEYFYETLPNLKSSNYKNQIYKMKNIRNDASHLYETKKITDQSVIDMLIELKKICQNHLQ
jgi:CheY-like chemotaxis protein